ncbi:MAG: hypothetical protein QM578_02775 [Pantoea sp.]|uniref:hypothetical protein n=1 Tax=Pantoea sp. TaxID=69393 RepID=UPI0039E2AFBF
MSDARAPAGRVMVVNAQHSCDKYFLENDLYPNLTMSYSGFSMKTVKAFYLAQAQELLNRHQVRIVELCFELSSDEFFCFADEWYEKGAEICKREYFIIKLNSFTAIPPAG